MADPDRGGPRRAPHETAGTVDHPFDDDRPGSHPLIQTDAACSIPWLADGFEAVQIFVDPAARDQIEAICATVTGLCGRHTSLDDLSAAVQRYAADNGLSASVHERPPDALSEDLVAISFTYG